MASKDEQLILKSIEISQDAALLAREAVTSANYAVKSVNEQSQRLVELDKKVDALSVQAAKLEERNPPSGIYLLLNKAIDKSNAAVVGLALLIIVVASSLVLPQVVPAVLPYVVSEQVEAP